MALHDAAVTRAPVEMLESIVFSPAAETVAASQLTAFERFVTTRSGQTFVDYRAFEEWSTNEYRTFWTLFLEWSALTVEGSWEPVSTSGEVETATFFPGLRLSYAENLLSPTAPGTGSEGDRPAITACAADGVVIRLTRRELRDAVVRTAAAFQELGLREGDRVAAVVRNTADAVVAALAAATLGATFSSAAADMGAFSTLARFRQLDPTLLIAHLDSPRSGPAVDMAGRVAEIAAGLPTLQAIVALDTPGPVADPTARRFSVPVHSLAELQAERHEDGETFLWPRFAFNHPLFVLFSSGTTGRPKCIVHGAGGTLIEHVKEHRLHSDLGAGDRLFFQTSAAWMMWNWQLSALAGGAEIVLYDGPVAGPQTLWDLVSAQAVTVFGTSPPYLRLCQDLGFSPREHVPLPHLRALLSTGSILTDRQYDWVRAEVGDLPLQSISGGTDIIGCFVLGNPNLPVHRGEAQCRSLGLDVAADGATDASPIGELICRNPFPSRPVGLYGDTDGSRFHAAYFAQQPGVWTHGDRIELTASGGARIHGRSDSVLNINGTRVGPAEIYQIVEDIPPIKAAMAVEQPDPRTGGSRLVLLVVTERPGRLTAELDRHIRRELATRASSAHVPALVVEVPDLPTTFSGKRSEAAVRHLLAGTASGNTEALANPETLAAIDWQVKLADARLSSADTAISSPPPAGDDALVDTLRRAMAGVLGLADIGADDNFYELGGDSLRTVTMLQVVARRLHRDLAPTVLLTAPTPRMLAATLGGAAQAGSAGQAVTLRAGTGRPVFFLPGLGGDVFDLRLLAARLATDRPIVGMRARGLDPHQQPHTSISEMAEYYLAQLRVIQPVGPYTLLGFSFGGLVSYEMARLLRLAGDDVDLLVLLDTHVVPREPERYQAWHRAWRISTFMDVARAPRRQLPRMLLQIAAKRISWVTVPAHLLDFPVAVQRVADEGDWPAYVGYEPQSYPHELVLVRAQKRRAVYGEPLPDWQRLTGGRVTVVKTPGDHTSLLKEPNVAFLSAQLSSLIQATEPAEDF
jgi:acetoacetyl-CoA synthetase